jgi:hypothetical protein
MKKGIFVLAIIAVLSLAVAAMAASPVVKVRVVNVDVLGGDAVSSDEGLVKTATMSIAENAKVFPAVETMVLRVGKDQAKYTPDVTLPAGALSFSGSLTEEQMMEFVSLPNPGGAGKIDGAVISRDGKVTYLDDPIVIDYKLRTITTPGSLTVKDGDVLLLFTKNAEKIAFGHESGVVEDYYTPNNPTDGRNPTHGGRGPTGQP